MRSPSSPSATPESHINPRRPRRAATLCVDYSLKRKKKGALAPQPQNTSSSGSGTPVVVVDRNETHFNEPKVVDPVGQTTGCKISEFPPEKYRREALWDPKKKPEFDSQVENKYKRRLKKEVSAAFSEIRKPIVPVENPRGSPIEWEPLDYHRCRAPNLPLYEGNSNDHCSTCGEPGEFICCDTCPKSFHLMCCDPPLDFVPEGDWSCKRCHFRSQYPSQSSRKQGLNKFKKENRVWGNLQFKLESYNPLQFELPESIRNEFSGVSTGPYGEYEDGTFKPDPNFKTPYGQSVTRQDTFQPEHHYHDGSLLLCFKCRKSEAGTVDTMNNKIITQCDYCGEAWHLDCLDPPLPAIKLMGSKWKCPLHAEIPNKKRRFKDRPLKVPDVPYGLKNDGNIEILALPESAVQVDFFTKIKTEREIDRQLYIKENQRLIDAVLGCGDVAVKKAVQGLTGNGWAMEELAYAARSSSESSA